MSKSSYSPIMQYIDLLLLYRLKLLMNFKTAPAFSLSKSLKKSITDMVPHNHIAPGPIYNVFGMGQRSMSLSHSIGKSKRTEINHRLQQTPSPLHYEPKKLSSGSHKTIPKASLIEISNLNPDPSCYTANEKLTSRNVLTYTLSSRYPSVIDQNNKNPGPADYQSQQPPILTRSKNVKHTSFGTGSRFKNQQDPIPGAGQYDCNSSRVSHQFEQSYSMGKADRHPAIKVTPGPSDYPKASFIDEKIKAKLGKSLGGRLNGIFLNEHTTINAFHKYFQNPENQYSGSKASPKFSISKDKRQLFKPNPNPGPNEYINNYFLPKHSSAALIPRSQHIEDADSKFKPGPGTYQIEEDKGLQYSFPKSKSVANVQMASPGVGRYDLQDLKFAKGSIFSKSGRFVKQSNFGAGVGDYELQTRKQFKGSISKSSRFKNDLQTTPGPGDYHIKNLMGLKTQVQK